MIIPGLMLPTQAVPAAVPDPGGRLVVGDVLTGRVTQMSDEGRGVIRFPDGRGFSFVRAPDLKVGEAVRVELLRTSPDMAFRLLASSSWAAAGLAASAEQSLVRAPDIFANLLRWSGSAAGNLALLQKTLPNVSMQALLQGELTGLTQLLEAGSRQDVRSMIQQLRQGSVELLLAEQAPVDRGQRSVQEETPDLRAARNTLHRLGDLLAMQEILPRTALSAEGGELMGYRLFWLMEGGLGEAIWYKKRGRRPTEEGGDRSDGGEGGLTTVLLSLNMTALGAIQARLSYGEGICTVHIAAEQEESLSALRRRVDELRRALLAAELPLRSLDLARLMPGELKEQRMRALGLASDFSVRA
ncbi:MAG: flagellar hook-length control protein FliK [Magnetococcus sp. MYC-9]